jgi:hypothetical protein
MQTEDKSEAVADAVVLPRGGVGYIRKIVNKSGSDRYEVRLRGEYLGRCTTLTEAKEWIALARRGEGGGR